MDPRTHLIVGGFPPGAMAGHDMDFARLSLLGLLGEREDLTTTVANDFTDLERWLEGGEVPADLRGRAGPQRGTARGAERLAGRRRTLVRPARDERRPRRTHRRRAPAPHGQGRPSRDPRLLLPQPSAGMPVRGAGDERASADGGPATEFRNRRRALPRGADRRKPRPAHHGASGRSVPARFRLPVRRRHLAAAGRQDPDARLREGRGGTARWPTLPSGTPTRGAPTPSRSWTSPSHRAA